MADNSVANLGTGGDTFATDDIGGVKYPRTKLIHGADGVNAGDVSTANPLPTVQTGAIPAGTNNIGDVDVLTLPALVAGTANIGDVDVLTLPAIPAGTNNIGDVDVLTVPADPFGANADAASATGSISAKLKNIAINGIPITGNVQVVNGGSFNVIADTELPTAAALADATANPTIPSVGSDNMLFNGTTWDRARGDITNGLDVDVTRVPANQSVNVTQLVGTAADVNSGVKSAGTLRVVLATDQPALTNKLLVTPDSVALPANQSINNNQVVGTTIDVNSGLKSAGTMRVVLATDQPALTNKLLVTPDSVALPANQSVNMAQVAGTATDVNSGNKSAGTQRVVLATDQPALTTPLPTKETRSATATLSNVADSATSVTVLASNANRLGATIENDSTATLYLKFGATASLTSYTVQVVANAYYEVPFGYTGIIDGIWATDPNTGSARVTELTA